MPVTKDDLTPWSISKGQVAQDCSFRFHLRYIKKARKQKIERSEGRIGAAAHLLIEHYLEGLPYKQAFRKAALANPLTKKEIFELKTFQKSVLSFKKRFKEWRDKMGVADDEFWIEKDVAFSEDMEATGYWDNDNTFFRGKWDIGALVRRGGKKYMIIIDHKTGEPPPPDADDPLEKYTDQLDAYIASAYALDPDIAGAQTAIHWMREDDRRRALMWGPMVPTEKIQDEIMPWFWGYFDDASDNVMQSPKPTKGWYCQFCEYQYKCPLMR